MNNIPFWLYLLTMAGVTYLIRMLPLVLIKKKIKNRFILSFLYYIPYAVLSVMTIPAIFSSTSYLISAILGFAAAIITAFFKKDLLTVALVACGFVLETEVIIKYVI
ncbi:MAG: AzlD domain-containing protein [Clostridia bacterium]|nr:AzlD domain-containing protein [Clostridia bacterium]